MHDGPDFGAILDAHASSGGRRRWWRWLWLASIMALAVLAVIVWLLAFHLRASREHAPVTTGQMTGPNAELDQTWSGG